MDASRITVYDQKLKFTPLEFETMDAGSIMSKMNQVKIYSVGV